MVNVEKQIIGSPDDLSHLGNAAVAPGILFNPKLLDIDEFICSYYHPHDGLLKPTVMQLGITLPRSLKSCNACAQSKGAHGSIASTIIIHPNE